MATHETPRTSGTDTDRPPTADNATSPDSRAEVDPDVAELIGLRPDDADPYATTDEVDDAGELTDTRIYQGDLEARPPDSDQPDRPAAESLESLASEAPRAGETDDPNEAAEEGLTWVPPVDPPIRPGEGWDPEVAAGFGTTAGDEPFDADHHGELLSDRDEVTDRVLEALHADAATSALMDRVAVDTEGGRVLVAGIVDDLEDEDAIVAVASEVDGVVDVVSRLTVAAVENNGESPAI